MQHSIPLDGSSSGDAIFSDCARYRYSLQRVWAPAQKPVVMVGLNPSTADAVSNDPTIRRAMDFARRWGRGGLIMVNLFAYRSTDPKALRQVEDPVGPDNDHWIKYWCEQVDLVVAVWGNEGRFLGRDVAVRALCGQLHALKINASGQPAHPLYLPSGLTPKVWA